ncbi:ABC transporter permease [Roseivirga sp.]|uniref:ABC transporter permease n=1 Tax=Roseivirga sp. TaxID=1964215 RepID=UPI003B8E82C0
MLKKVGQKLIKFYCHPDFQEDILGDLEEYHELHFEDKGARYADRKFLIDALLLFRLSLLRDKWFSQQLINTPMVRNIFKTAFRVFWKESGYSLMNILGLTVGIAASMLLLLYVESEKSVNQFHKDIDNIYQVMEHQTYPGGVRTFEDNPGPLVTVFRDEMPEVDYMAAFTRPYKILLSVDNEGHKETGMWASEDFFQIFDVDFIEGQKESSLTEPSTVYISKRVKERIFGSEPALTKSINFDGWGDFQVGGVFEDVPNATTIDFDFVLPYQGWREVFTWVELWENSGVRGIAKLSPGTDVGAFNKKIAGYINQKIPDKDHNVSIFVQPLKDRYLYNNYENGVIAGGRITYAKLLTAVAYFILLIAIINFVNLATARSTKRAKEVGVKKIVGSTRGLLRAQFMVESILLALISTVLAGVVIMSVVSPLNMLVGKSMTFSFASVDQGSKLLIIGLGVGLLAGIYPALVLSSFKPLSVVKGSFKTSGWSNGIRKGLVVFQFTISTVLIIATLVVRNQMDFIKSKNLGYDKEHLVTIPVEGALRDKVVQEQFKSTVLSNSNFKNVSFSGGTPLSFFSSTDAGFSWEGKVGDLSNKFRIINTDTDFFETYGMEIIEGRGFDPELATDTLNYIINEQAAAAMNVENPISLSVSLWGSPGRIVGVVKDFHYSSLHEKIGPLVMPYRPNYPTDLTIKMTGQNVVESITFLENVTAELNPSYPFDYSFVDVAYEQLYQGEATIGVLANYFSAIAIFISLLGLFGLSSFSADQRIKEIGIRKILGARVSQLTFHVSKGFLILVGVGFVLAAPLGYGFMNNWLQTFEYRTEIGVTVFILSAGISMFITLLAVSYHALKAAYTNPITNLRTE